MDAAELRLIYEPDDEYLGELFAEVKSGAFAGMGSDWFDRIQLKETFVAALRAFPLDPNSLPAIGRKNLNRESFELLDQRHLHIAISPYDRRGTLHVQVDLASPSYGGVQQAVIVRFLTEYSAVADFAERLDKMLDGAAKEAVLKGFRT
ncbi:MAG TPA: hypothetical protein VFE34_00935 [Dongiaceae bacterium]|jgi:hypothetical protein|nr:hypothetical protein [Dongiaceae bacterium]